jgi:hypothetical protein
VPESSREDLRLALGKPERIGMNFDHEPDFYSITPLGFNWIRRRIGDFLEARLLNEPPSHPDTRYEAARTSGSAVNAQVRPVSCIVQPGGRADGAVRNSEMREMVPL